MTELFLLWDLWGNKKKNQILFYMPELTIGNDNDYVWDQFGFSLHLTRSWYGVGYGSTLCLVHTTAYMNSVRNFLLFISFSVITYIHVSVFSLFISRRTFFRIVTMDRLFSFGSTIGWKTTSNWPVPVFCDYEPN